MSKAEGVLHDLRRDLDRVDEEIVRLVARRLDTVGRIAETKTHHPEGLRDADREREVLSRVESVARSLGISGPLTRRLFSEIITHSLTRQASALSAAPGQEIAVACPGSRLTPDGLAADKYAAGLGVSARLIEVATLGGAVDRLEAGAADLAFLPIENTTAGSINEVYDLLRERDVHIVGEETFVVDLCLAGTAEVPLGTLREIVSAPVALAQCSAFVQGLPQARPVPATDTAEAARLVAASSDPSRAAICSPEAVAAHGLTVLRRGIGNEQELLVRYVALSRTPAPLDLRVPAKTSLVLSTRHEKGALLACLQVLADYGISLTKLESRPRPNRPWEYLFFVDIEGNHADPNVAAALDQLRSQGLYLKVLGSYPAVAKAPEARASAVETRASVPDVPAPAPTPRPRSKNYKLADRASRSEDTLVRVGDLLIGGSGFTVMAGPCSVESADQIQATASFVREHGAHVLRGGVFKPRTSPYAFQGLGYEGLELLAKAGRESGMPIITEVMAPDQVRPVAELADILQIGARNMQNFSLLKEVGKVDRPVLLKRGLSSTIDEWLGAAEYILAQGNGQVILCERGIRTFESATRNTLDLSAVVVLRERTHLPVIVDPSHGTGKRAYVAPMAYAARACGAHGLLIEVHPDPEHALSDGDQSLTLPEFASMMSGLARFGR